MAGIETFMVSFYGRVNHHPGPENGTSGFVMRLAWTWWTVSSGAIMSVDEREDLGQSTSCYAVAGKQSDR
jgi:hypothetical protein